jgi:hypothetical protein
MAFTEIDKRRLKLLGFKGRNPEDGTCSQTRRRGPGLSNQL